jgi:hypothetical protein
MNNLLKDYYAGLDEVKEVFGVSKQVVLPYRRLT